MHYSYQLKDNLIIKMNFSYEKINIQPLPFVFSQLSIIFTSKDALYVLYSAL